MTVQVNEQSVKADASVIGANDADLVRIRVDERRVKRFAKDVLGASFTHDNYFAKMMEDEKTARLFFEVFLPPKALRQLDLETLRAVPTKLVDESGEFCVGDMFFTVEMKRRKGKKSPRAVFMLVLEHKSEHETFVSIQLLNYVARLLNFMRANSGTFLDEKGLLPAPFAIVFSQDKRPWRRVPYLERVLWTLRGFRSYLPRLKFFVVEASEIPLEKIRKLEPVTRLFLYLERLAKREYEKGENQELIELFSDLINAPNPNERLRQGFSASLRYLKYLQKGRPQMITTRELQNGIYGQDVESDYDVIEEFFSDAFEFKGKQKFEQGRTSTIYDVVLKNYRRKYGVELPEALVEKINAVGYYPALEEIQCEVWLTPSPEAFERRVDSIIEQYAEENESLVSNER